MKHATDSELISSYKKNEDLKVLGALYERYMPLVYGVSLKYLADREEAKDVTMQLFEKLTTELLKHEVNNFKSWLHVMTRNHCLMLIRSGKTAQNIKMKKEWEESVEYSISPHPMEEDSAELEQKTLDKCLEQLPKEQEKCIRLFYMEEKSYREVASSSGFELKKVKSHIQNGKRNLKNCLEKNAVQ